MIWINGNIAEYEKAINGLNFDKYGHETGLGSWGIRTVVQDGFAEPAVMYFGVKFDVLTIATDRFIGNFINIEKRFKDMCQKTKKIGLLNTELSGTSTYVPDIGADSVITFYVDIHKIDIDIVELWNTVYLYKTDVEEYASIARDKVFKTFGKRSSRGISATMGSVYDGNLEQLGFLHTRSSTEFLMNEMIVPEEKVSDEIRYTYWLTPHDREDYNFFKNDGLLLPEGSNPDINSFGEETVLGSEPIKRYTFPKRTSRFGYHDVDTENPLINSGYGDGDTTATDTFFFSENTMTKTHKHSAKVEIDSNFKQLLSKAFSTLPSSMKNMQLVAYVGMVSSAVIQMEAYNIWKRNESGSIIEKLNSRVDNGMVETILRLSIYTYEFSLTHQAGEIPGAVMSKLATMDTVTGKISSVEHIDISLFHPASIAGAKLLFKKSVVLPLVLLNKIHSTENMNTVDLKETVLLVHHPILDKTVFYEVGQSDSAIVEENKIEFYSDGTKYGLDNSGDDVVFTWSNIEKRSRKKKPAHLTMTGRHIGGDLYYDGPDTSFTGEVPATDIARKMLDDAESMQDVFVDLDFNGDCAKIMAINKTDLLDIIKKTRGTLDSEYILGTKSGDVKLNRSGLWM